MERIGQYVALAAMAKASIADAGRSPDQDGALHRIQDQVTRSGDTGMSQVVQSFRGATQGPADAAAQAMRNAFFEQLSQVLTRVTQAMLAPPAAVSIQVVPEKALPLSAGTYAGLSAMAAAGAKAASDSQGRTVREYILGALSQASQRNRDFGMHATIETFRQFARTSGTADADGQTAAFLQHLADHLGTLSASAAHFTVNQDLARQAEEERQLREGALKTPFDKDMELAPLHSLRRNFDAVLDQCDVSHHELRRTVFDAGAANADGSTAPRVLRKLVEALIKNPDIPDAMKGPARMLREAVGRCETTDVEADRYTTMAVDFLKDVRERLELRPTAEVLAAQADGLMVALGSCVTDLALTGRMTALENARRNRNEAPLLGLLQLARDPAAAPVAKLVERIEDDRRFYTELNGAAPAADHGAEAFARMIVDLKAFPDPATLTAEGEAISKAINAMPDGERVKVQVRLERILGPKPPADDPMGELLTSLKDIAKLAPLTAQFARSRTLYASARTDRDPTPAEVSAHVLGTLCNSFVRVPTDHDLRRVADSILKEIRLGGAQLQADIRARHDHIERDVARISEYDRSRPEHERQSRMERLCSDLSIFDHIFKAKPFDRLKELVREYGDLCRRYRYVYGQSPGEFHEGPHKNCDDYYRAIMGK